MLRERAAWYRVGAQSYAYRAAAAILALLAELRGALHGPVLAAVKLQQSVSLEMWLADG